MQFELKRVEPMRLANVGALVYGITMGVVALLFVPFFLIIMAIAASEDPDALAMVPAAVMLLLYPVFGLVFGWLGGLLTAAVYNMIVRLTGGLLFDFEAKSAPPAA